MAVERISFGSMIFKTTYDFARLERNFCKVAGLYQGQPRILTILRENEGLTLSELSPICGIGMPSLSVSLRNMQKSGLIRKEGSGKNQKIFLTETGLEKALCFHEQIDEFYRELLDHVGQEASEAMEQSFKTFDNYLTSYNEAFERRHGWKKD